MEPSRLQSETPSLAQNANTAAGQSLRTIDIQIEKLVRMCQSREDYYENQINANIYHFTTHKEISKKGGRYKKVVVSVNPLPGCDIKSEDELKKSYLPFLRYDFIKNVNFFISKPCYDFWKDFKNRALILQKRLSLFHEIFDKSHLKKAKEGITSSFNEFENIEVLQLNFYFRHSNSNSNLNEKIEIIFKTIEGTPPEDNSIKEEVIQVIENIENEEQFENATAILKRRAEEEQKKNYSLIEYYPNNGDPKEFRISCGLYIPYPPKPISSLRLVLVKKYKPVQIRIMPLNTCLIRINKLGKEYCEKFLEDEKKLQQKLDDLQHFFQLAEQENQKNKSLSPAITTTQEQDLQHTTLISNALYSPRKPKRKVKGKKGKEEVKTVETRVEEIIPLRSPTSSLSRPKIFLDTVNFETFLAILGDSLVKKKPCWNEILDCLAALSFTILPKGGSKYKFKFEKQIAFIDEISMQEEVDEIIEKAKIEMESLGSSKRIDEPHGPGRSKTSPLSDNKLHQFRSLLLACALTKECVQSVKK